MTTAPRAPAAHTKNASSGRPYPHLLRRKRMEDLWLLAMLVRQTHLASVLLEQKPLLAIVARQLRLGDADLTEPQQVRSIAQNLQATYARMRMHSQEFQLPRVLCHNLTLLTQRMGLSEAEQRVLALAILLRSNHTLFMAANATDRSINLAQQIAQVIGSPLRAVINAVAPDSLLQRSRLVEITAGDSLGGNVRLARASFRRLALERLTEFDAMLGGVVRTGQRSEMTADAFAHLIPSPDAIRALLGEALRTKRKGVNILLYGAPGTGKTEFARLMAQKLGSQIFEVSSTELGGAPLEAKQRLGCAATAQVLLMKLRAILVFDEIDAAFTDGSELFGKPTTAESTKCWVNDLLERNPVPMIWIANRIGGMDPAFIRRFDLVVHVDTPPQAARLALLRQECSFMEEAQRSRLARADRVTPAVIVRAAGVAARVGADDRDKAVLMEALLDGVLKAQGLPAVRQQCRNAPPDHYDIALCNADVDLASICDGLLQRPTGRICLYGPPGTGKSAFGAWVAQRLDRPLILKRISDLQSPWLGEMERNLAKAFEQADRDGAILQIDEVDSYLQDRRNAQRSWEVSQVNEFLTQLEAFDGVFIASTNLMEGLDSAALRRFDFKIRMGYLTPQQVRDLIIATARDMRLDAAGGNALHDIVKSLSRLTPGDFAVLKRQHRTRPFSSVDQLANALRQEQALKQQATRRIGFV